MIIARIQSPPAVPAGKKKPQVPNADARDVGVVAPLDAPPAAMWTFTLRGPVVVTRLSPSCHCVSAALSAAGGATNLPRTLAPGDVLSVAVSVGLSELRSGPFTRTVVVYAKLRSGSAEFVLARLAVRGTLLPAVAFVW